jgi:hypothetical protein
VILSDTANVLSRNTIAKVCEGITLTQEEQQLLGLLQENPEQGLSVAMMRCDGICTK